MRKRLTTAIGAVAILAATHGSAMAQTLPAELVCLPGDEPAAEPSDPALVVAPPQPWQCVTLGVDGPRCHDDGPAGAPGSESRRGSPTPDLGAPCAAVLPRSPIRRERPERHEAGGERPGFARDVFRPPRTRPGR